MASPQTEDGFTKIAHEILEALARTDLTGLERRILDVVFRETYGRHKKMAVLRCSFLSAKTGIRRNHMNRPLSSLIEKQILISEKVSPQKIAYGFQKDWEKWQNCPHTGCKTVPIQGDKLSPYKGTVPAHYKDIKIKDREFPDKNEGTFPLLGEEKSLSINPIEGQGPQCPTRIGVAMDQILKKKRVGNGKR